MKYYTYDQSMQMKENAWNCKIDGVLNKYFGDIQKWGADVIFDENKNVETIEICKLSDVTLDGETWTHYASIGLYKSVDDNNKQYWEVYSLFNGEKEDELWVFSYYKNFGDAARRVYLGIENLKPIKKF